MSYSTTSATITGSVLGLEDRPAASEVLTPEAVAAPTRPRAVRVLWKWSLAATAVLIAYFVWQLAAGLTMAQASAYEAIDSFHAQLNRGDYQAIVEGADDGFSKGWTEEELVRFFGRLHTRLGNAGATSGCMVGATATLTQTFVTARCNTTFEKGEGVETFSWIKSDNVLRLRSYYISSKALTLD